MAEYEQLIYRGDFRCEVGIDYSGSFLGIDYGGGLDETEKVFPGLLTAKLSYPHLDRDVIPHGALVNRLDYIWGGTVARIACELIIHPSAQPSLIRNHTLEAASVSVQVATLRAVTHPFVRSLVLSLPAIF